MTQSPSPAAGSTSPLNSANADAHRSAAPRSSPASSKLSRRGRVAQHRERVDLGRIDGELVAAVAADDHRRVTERAAQPGDLRLQGVALGVDGVVAPQVLDEPVGAHDEPASRARRTSSSDVLPAGNGDELTVAPDLDRAEHRDLQHVGSRTTALRPLRSRALSGTHGVGRDPGDDQAVRVVDQVVARQRVDQVAARCARWARAIATTCRSRSSPRRRRPGRAGPGCRSSSAAIAITTASSIVSACAATRQMASASPPIALSDHGVDAVVGHGPSVHRGR